MKHVFNSAQIPHIWANQTQEDARNAQGNFYFEGATIYSYGKHFPIATIEGHDVLFTLRTYSNTTSGHISDARRAISHKNIIYCYEVPVKYYNDKKPLKKQSFTSLHETNTNHWKGEIKRLFAEVGNTRNRNITERIAEINRNIEQLKRYNDYFGLKVKDSELKSLLSIAAQPDFVAQARTANVKQYEATQKKLKQAAKAYDIYLSLWRNYDNEGLKELPTKTKELCNFYQNNSEALTRLRFNREQNRLETSKGIQIPVAIAKKAYKELNGCMEGTCDNIAVPVMDYTITKTTKDTIIAGCHTIPKSDVNYIAELLNW